MIKEKTVEINQTKSQITLIKENYCTNLSISELKTHILDFTSIDHVNRLKHQFIPAFEKFGARMSHYIAEIHKLEDCVKQFDVVLNLKANKSQLIVFEDKLLQ